MSVLLFFAYMSIHYIPYLSKNNFNLLSKKLFGFGTMIIGISTSFWIQATDRKI